MLNKQRDLDWEFDAAIRRVIPYLIYSGSHDRDELARMLISLAHNRLTTHVDSFEQIFSAIENYIATLDQTLTDETQKDISNLETYMMGISDSIGDLRIRMSNLEQKVYGKSRTSSESKKRGRSRKYALHTEFIPNSKLESKIIPEGSMKLEKPNEPEGQIVETNYMEVNEPYELEPYVTVRGKVWNVYEYVRKNLHLPKYHVIQCIIDNSASGIRSLEIEQITGVQQVPSILSKLKYNDPMFGKFIGVKYDRAPEKRRPVPSYYWKLSKPTTPS